MHVGVAGQSASIRLPVPLLAGRAPSGSVFPRKRDRLKPGLRTVAFALPSSPVTLSWVAAGNMRAAAFGSRRAPSLFDSTLRPDSSPPEHAVPGAGIHLPLLLFTLHPSPFLRWPRDPGPRLIKSRQGFRGGLENPDSVAVHRPLEVAKKQTDAPFTGVRRKPLAERTTIAPVPV